MMETLLFPYRKNILAWPAGTAKILFINAEDHADIQGMSITAVQPRYDLAAVLQRKSFTVVPDILPEHQNQFDVVWALPRKDKQETQYLLAAGLSALREGGILLAAAANDAGGKRLEDMFISLGLAPAAESKNKARVVYAEKTAQWNKAQAEIWIAEGQMQAVMEGTIFSRPGLHSWDGVDEGSQILARYLPKDMNGTIADFGCGWGYLSLQAAALSPALHQLTLVDVDARAVELAKRNLQKRHPHVDVQTQWADLTPSTVQLGPFDTILLNPPFHYGTRAVPALGQAIIATAARSLTASGTLYLVANRHLPYEQTLRNIFKQVDLLVEEGGFKVFTCRRPTGL